MIPVAPLSGLGPNTPPPAVALSPYPQGMLSTYGEPTLLLATYLLLTIDPRKLRKGLLVLVLSDGQIGTIPAVVGTEKPQGAMLVGAVDDKTDPVYLAGMLRRTLSVALA